MALCMVLASFCLALIPGSSSLEYKVSQSVNFSATASKEMFNIHENNLNYNTASTWSSCPPGYYRTHEQGDCKCGDDILPYSTILCRDSSLSVQGCYCVTYNEDWNLTEVGKCFYNCGNIHKRDLNKKSYIEVPRDSKKLNDFMCGRTFNRRGTLCGRCKHGFYPLVYSFNMTCVKCPGGKSNWWKFLFIAFLPNTLFYFVVVFFKINVTSSNLQGFVHYSQIISMTAMARMVLLGSTQTPTFQTALRYYGNLYGIWNLDLLRFVDFSVCLRTDNLQTLALDIVVGIYPLLLVILSYFLIILHDHNFRPLVIIWKPFHRVFSLFRRNWDIRTSIIDAFATFFFLSNVKFLNVAFDFLAPIQVYQLDSTGHLTYSWRLFYDATVPYFGTRHLPYAIIAIAVLVLFVLLPVLLLILYPFRWFQKLLNRLPFRCYVLHTFADAFQGCYKDGTEPGTRDCRWFVSIVFITHVLLLTIGAATLSSIYYSIASVILVVNAILYTTMQPFKAKVSHYSDINAIFNLLLAVWYVTTSGFELCIIKKFKYTFLLFMVIAASLPLLYISAIILRWLFMNRRFGLEAMGRYRAWRQGYDWWSIE